MGAKLGTIRFILGLIMVAGLVAGVLLPLWQKKVDNSGNGIETTIKFSMFKVTGCVTGEIVNGTIVPIEEQCEHLQDTKEFYELPQCKDKTKPMFMAMIYGTIGGAACGFLGIIASAVSCRSDGAVGKVAGFFLVIAMIVGLGASALAFALFQMDICTTEVEVAGTKVSSKVNFKNDGFTIFIAPFTILVAGVLGIVQCFLSCVVSDKARRSLDDYDGNNQRFLHY